MSTEVVGRTSKAALTSLLHWNSVVILVAGGAAGYVVHARNVHIAEAVFTAAITVLVFLIPAAAVTGEFLTRELRDAASIVARPDLANQAGARRTVGATLESILDSARPLQRGFVYCTGAVILAAIGLLNPTLPGLGTWPESIASGVALMLLVGTAVTAFPMAWRLLEFEPVREAYRLLFRDRTSPPAGPDSSGVTVPTPPTQPDPQTVDTAGAG